jgi:signal peptide peptidase SppA
MTPAILGQIVAMVPDRIRTVSASLDSAAVLAAAGLSPADRAKAAYLGTPTIVPTVSGDVATLALHGPMLARAPWYAVAFAGCLDPYAFANALDAIIGDPQYSTIKSVVIEVDSCGGTVAGAGEIAAAVARVQATGRTVQARVEGTCASAAYRAICGADKIAAGSDSVVGSIGVYAVVEDETGHQTAEGCIPEVISSAPLKGLGADGRITPALRSDLKRLVDAHAAVFFDAVSSARGLTGPALDAVTTGQVWIASEALRLGLVDAIGSAADAPTIPGTTDQPIPIPVPADLEGDDEESTKAATPHLEPTESAMDPKTQAALVRLTASHPTLAASLVAAAAEPGATAEQLDALAAQANSNAKDAEIAALKADLAAANAKATEALSAANRLGAHLPQHGDPGPGDAGPSKEVRIIPVAQAGNLTAEDWSAIKAGQAKFG